MFRMVFVGALLVGLALPLGAGAQSSDNNQDKNFDVRSSVGDLHIGADADAKKIGLPLYPGARLKNDDANSSDSNRVNMGVWMEAFGFHLVVANYDSDDSPGKVIDFYRDKLKKYGKVLECHTRKHGGDVDAHNDDDDKDSDKSKEKASRPVKCDDNNGGPVTELKAGTEDNQHVVAIEPRDSGKGATFALVYVRMRGKQGDI